MTYFHAGGYSENYTSTLNSVEVYDPNTNTWTAVPDMPTPRGDLMCATINNALVVIGGYYDVTGARSMYNNWVPTKLQTMQVVAHSNCRAVEIVLTECC